MYKNAVFASVVVSVLMLGGLSKVEAHAEFPEKPMPLISLANAASTVTNSMRNRNHGSDLELAEKL